MTRKRSTLASAAGLTFPDAKKAPPSTTILFTLLAKDASLLIAYKKNEKSMYITILTGITMTITSLFDYGTQIKLKFRQALKKSKSILKKLKSK